MCGLTGFIDRGGQADRGALAERISEMTDRLVHRGPDDVGTWTDPEAGVALGFRRLSIIDLSPAGHQPMVSADGRYVIAYNGEIYNYRELRQELESQGHRFRGHSDTEVVLEGFVAWGVGPTLQRLIGMFAIGLWDRRERTMALIRDRMGIKPMYWTRQGNLFLFGSELKALTAHPGWTPEIDRSALAAYFRFNYIPAPHSIYRDVQKLEPGRHLVFGPGTALGLSTYWDVRTVALEGRAQPLDVSDDEAVEQLESLLGDAVKRRMIADVPLGAFLSGGVDSSAVVALMQAQSASPVRTYSIGFRERDHDESRYASEIAGHLGTDHTEYHAEPEHALEVIPSLPEMFDEPFADSSQIPTHLVSRLTRSHVTVALSGDGGDELFAGYNRYVWGESVHRRLGWLPPAMRRGLAGLMTLPSPAVWDRMAGLLPRRIRLPQTGDKIAKLAGVIASTDAQAIYRRLVSHWPRPEALVRGAVEPTGLLWDSHLAAELPDIVERMQLLDMMTYLPDDILTKVDRASMAASLEVRVPILDHRVVEFSWRLPSRMKLRGRESKWLLRQLLYKHVPRRLIERPKQGFAVPVGQWLRGPLRDWAEDLLDERTIREEGLLDSDPIRQSWVEHLSGHRNWQYQLWGVLMFQAWLRHEPQARAGAPPRASAGK